MEKTREGASILTGMLLGMFGLTFNEYLALGGFIFAGATFAVNWNYKKKYYKLAERAQERLDRENN